MTNPSILTLESSKNLAISWLESFQMPFVARPPESASAKAVREAITRRSNERMQLLDSIESQWLDIKTSAAEEKEKEIRYLGLKQALFDHVYYELGFVQEEKELRGGIRVLVGLLYDDEEGKSKDERFSIMGLWQRAVGNREQATMAQKDILYSAECIRLLRQNLMGMRRNDGDYGDDRQIGCGEGGELDGRNEAVHSDGEYIEHTEHNDGEYIEHTEHNEGEYMEDMEETP
ncbi:hypothetical protein BZA77DRAFT_293593 [Pyronema omphalodes]|nr:hypothetical protein BZA77DRAFT_293593 [Pyronema omphalodes]